MGETVEVPQGESADGKTNDKTREPCSLASTNIPGEIGLSSSVLSFDIIEAKDVVSAGETQSTDIISHFRVQNRSEAD